jgi:hypothetical protein
MFLHNLEIRRAGESREITIGWLGVPKGLDYNFGFSESLYSGDPRWSVDRPLSGTMPGRVEILSLDDLSVAKTVDFEVDLGKVTRVQLDEMFTIQIVSSWESMGGVEFNYHIERREPDGTGYLIGGGPFAVLPGGAFYLKYLPVKLDPEQQKPLPPLPTN